MQIFEIFQHIKETAGTNDKKTILEVHKDNELLKKALLYGIDPMMPFHIVKVPKVKSSERRWPTNRATEEDRWNMFFDVADGCASRHLSGNTAIDTMHYIFCSVKPEEEA